MGERPSGHMTQSVDHRGCCLALGLPFIDIYHHPGCPPLRGLRCSETPKYTRSLSRRHPNGRRHWPLPRHPGAPPGICACLNVTIWPPDPRGIQHRPLECRETPKTSETNKNPPLAAARRASAAAWPAWPMACNDTANAYGQLLSTYGRELGCRPHAGRAVRACMCGVHV